MLVQTHNPRLRQLFWTVTGDIHAYHDTPEGLYLNIPEATHNAKLSVSALEGRHESVQKALQGPETEETTVKHRFKRKIRQHECFS